MKLSSFSEIADNRLESFSQLVVDPERYWAHIDGVHNIETLQDHINLVMHYAKRIVTVNNLDTVIDNLIASLTDNVLLAEEVKLMFVASIAYHDLGKINPEFQLQKMHNSKFSIVGLSIGSRHSVLSAYIYLFYFLERIVQNKDWEASVRGRMLAICYFFVFPIVKHHSSFLDKEDVISKELLEELLVFLKECRIDLPKQVVLAFSQTKEKLLKKFDTSESFSIFALLKLAYSLLTASDYYATNEFMAGLKVDDFGIISEEFRRKVVENFRTNKDYNRLLFEHFEDYQAKPFVQLEKRNNQNLNFLRQKLNAEVISTLRENLKSYWYYIEAPTGAGKTNLSLACISELLASDKSLNKVFYVFPFTTLITQTVQAIQETIGLNENEIIQLHSKAGFHLSSRYNDGEYGKGKRIFLDNLFVNYPFCVTSHVQFFDILKGNSKESNYLLHRLCNSVVVIDELQSYNPVHWDKVLYFIENYARYFNIRFIIMSATLPKIDYLSETNRGKFVNLTPNKRLYFSNPNFAGRIEFDFSLLDIERPTLETKEDYLSQLVSYVFGQAELYYQKFGHSRVLIEFITKNTASHFLRLLKENPLSDDYHLYLLSGDILEPQRKKVINELKAGNYSKVILVSTQVVEAGVDIDMDLGFKDRSLLDSDEQLAGRINRNASKAGCKVFLFDCDKTSTIYGKDKRYLEQQTDKELYSDFRKILQKKEYDKLYLKVFKNVLKQDHTDVVKLPNYLKVFNQLDFPRIAKEFKLIEDSGTISVFIPINIEIPENYSAEELNKWGVLTSDHLLSGEKLFNRYMSVVKNEYKDFSMKMIELKKVVGLLSHFTISVYPKAFEKIQDKCDPEKGDYGFAYLLHHEDCYSPEEGFNFERETESLFL